MRLIRTLWFCSLVFLVPQHAVAQAGAIDLLKDFDAERDAIKGPWKKTTSGLEIDSPGGSRCVLPGKVAASYSLTLEFTRQRGNDVVAVILPIGESSVALELSAWSGEAHGLARVDGETARSQKNPASVRPGTLTNGRQHRVDVAVAVKGAEVAIDVRLDGKKLLAYTGRAANLQPHVVFKLDTPGTLGLAAGEGRVTIHKAELTNAGIKDSTPAPAPRVTESDASQRRAISPELAALGEANAQGWVPFNGARFAPMKDGRRQGVAAVTDAGSGDRGAYLEGVTFTQGQIEVDLNGADQRGRSFVGVVFHGVDGDTYDAVYFRPFNFRAASPTHRSHAVQYIAHPDWPWEKLRQQKEGEYESAVKSAPRGDEWFRARIVIQGKRVRVYVNEAKEPCLDVEKLNDRRSGKVGLWFNGIASFANLKVTHAGDDTGGK